MMQILLESFPVSSSGHCVLFELYIKKYQYQINHYNDYFLHPGSSSIMGVALLDHFVHGVTVVLIALFFFSRWRLLLINFRRWYKIIIKIIWLTCIADAITFFLYVLFNYYVVSFSLMFGFVITSLLLLSLYVIPRFQRNWPAQSLTWRKAAILGFVQGCCLLPGISRLACTYVCARWMGISSYKSFEISWLLVWPLIVVAFVHSAAALIIITPESLLLSCNIIMLMAFAGFISWYALRLVAHMAYREKWWWFGIYMLLPIVISCLIS